MSKLDIGVGDEFPVDEGEPAEGGRHAWKQEYREHRRAMRAHRHYHQHGHGFGHHHRGRHFPILPLLLIGAGVWILVAAGKIPAASAAYGLVALGILAIVAMVAARTWYHRPVKPAVEQ